MPHPGRKRRRSAALATLGLTGIAAVAAAPASADHVTDGAVAVGHNLSVFHNLDFIAVSGFNEGDPLTIRIDRGERNIATLTAPAIKGDEGTGLELNHGPEGDPAPGECWDPYIPDVLPGDTVSVTYPTGPGATETDSTVVDDIEILRGMYRLGDDVAYEGVALRPNGTPIPLEQLDSGEVRADGAPKRIRANPTRIEAIPGVPGGWRAIHERSKGYGTFQNPQNATLNEQRDALVDFGDPAMGYGHIAPPPPIVQLVEGLGGGGPALGCPDIPFERNSLEGADRQSINIANAGSPVVVNGRAASDVAQPDDVRLSVNGAAVNATVTLGAGTWSASIPASALPAADGPVRIEADFPDSTFDTIPGARVTSIVLDKDTTAPAAPTADPAPGTYLGARSVTLSGEPGATIRYTNDGSQPTATSGQVASGPIPVTASQTLRAVAVDAAGNAGPVAQLAYTITQPPAQQQGTQQQDTQGTQQSAATGGASAGSGAGPITAPLTSTLSLDSLVTSSRVARSRVRSQGIRLVMRIADGTEVVRVRVYRKKRNGKRSLLATGFRTPNRTGLYRIRLTDPRLRRDLTPGSYVVEVTPGASRDQLGKSTRRGFKVVSGKGRRR